MSAFLPPSTIPQNTTTIHLWPNETADNSSWSLNNDNIFYTVMRSEAATIHPEFPVLEFILSGLGITFNLFILIMTLSISNLRSVKTSSFTVSLAVSDLLVSGVVMVTSSILHWRPPHIHTKHEDYLACYLWATVSIASCSASSLNVCVISIDRCILLTRPLNYDTYMTKFRIILLLFAVWTISICTAFVTFFIGVDSSDLEELVWVNDHGNHTIKQNSTYITFVSHCHSLPSRLYIISIVILIVFLPCGIVLCVYGQIFRIVIRQLTVIKQTKELAERFRITSDECDSNYILPSNFKEFDPSKVSRSQSDLNRADSPSRRPSWASPLKPTSGQKTLTPVKSPHFFNSPSPRAKSIPVLSQKKPDSAVDGMVLDDNMPISAVDRYQQENLSTNKRNSMSWASVGSYATGAFSLSQKTPRVNSYATCIFKRVSLTKNPELKAALVLLVIAGTYVICWLPFGVISIVQTMYPNTDLWEARQVLLWLAYSNSCWNPLINILNKNFRKSVLNIFVRRRCRQRRDSIFSQSSHRTTVSNRMERSFS